MYRLLVLLLLAACTAPLLPERGWRREVGLLLPELAPREAVVAPDTVRAGTDFTVTVTTHGSSSCTRADGAQADVRGLHARIVPYDLRRTGHDVVCTADLAPFPREVGLRFTEIGSALLRVHGRPVEDGAVVVERTIVVVP